MLAILPVFGDIHQKSKLLDAEDTTASLDDPREDRREIFFAWHIRYLGIFRVRDLSPVDSIEIGDRV